MAPLLPPVRYYVPFEEATGEEPQSPDWEYPPTSPGGCCGHLDEDDQEPRSPEPVLPSSPPCSPSSLPYEYDPTLAAAAADHGAAQANGMSADNNNPGYRMMKDVDAERALQYYNDDPSNEVKYELVEGTAWNLVFIGGEEAHVNFFARPAGAGEEAPPRFFFAEMRSRNPRRPTCIISLDDESEMHEDPQPECCWDSSGNDVKHPKGWAPSFVDHTL